MITYDGLGLEPESCYLTARSRKHLSLTAQGADALITLTSSPNVASPESTEDSHYGRYLHRFGDTTKRLFLEGTELNRLVVEVCPKASGVRRQAPESATVVTVYLACKQLTWTSCFPYAEQPPLNRPRRICFLYFEMIRPSSRTRPPRPPPSFPASATFGVVDDRIFSFCKKRWRRPSVQHDRSERNLNKSF